MAVGWLRAATGLRRKTQSKIESEGIKTIDMVRIVFTPLKQGIVPYHYDHSHWHEHVIKAVAKEIAEDIILMN